MDQTQTTRNVSTMHNCGNGAADWQNQPSGPPENEHPLVTRQKQFDPPRGYLTPKELAEWWAMAPHTLANWRHQGIGPVFTKVGARILYPVDEIIRYEKNIDPSTK